jgi:hypothetical protein
MGLFGLVLALVSELYYRAFQLRNACFKAQKHPTRFLNDSFFLPRILSNNPLTRFFNFKGQPQKPFTPPSVDIPSSLL